MSKAFSAKFRPAVLLILLMISSSIFAFVEPAGPQGQLAPDTTGLNVGAGDQVIWKEGHSPYLSVLLQDVLQVPPTEYADWYLVGHKIVFHSEGLSSENFLSHQALVKDNYSAKILRQFMIKEAPDFQFDYNDSSFSTLVGDITPFAISSGQIEKSATWEIINNQQNPIKTLKSKISYEVISYYTKADLSINGSLKLNLDQSSVNAGSLKFVRLAPGKTTLEKVTNLTAEGNFTVDSLAKGFYKVLYSKDGNNFGQTIIPLININELDQQLDLKLKFQTNYAIQLQYKKQSAYADITATLQWDQTTVALPYGIFPADTGSNLGTLPHFIGDFNSNVRLDRDGNPLTIPYADDNVDELIFLSWNDAATNQTLTGHYQSNTCSLKDSRDNRLYFTSTLKETEYGPWVLPAKKFYVNWSLSYECGPNHGSTIQTMPLVGTPVGGVNELGEIQAELSTATLQKIRNQEAFTQNWQFTDILDQSTVTITLQATPL